MRKRVANWKKATSPVALMTDRWVAKPKAHRHASGQDGEWQIHDRSHCLRGGSNSSPGRNRRPMEDRLLQAIREGKRSAVRPVRRVVWAPWFIE